MFDSLISLSESGLKMDGAVDRPELAHQGPYDYDMSPELRSELEEFVYAHTPCRHKFSDMRGQRGIVYFDGRGRAADALLADISSSELMRQARIHGWRGADDEVGVGSTPHGTGVLFTNGGAGYRIPYTESEGPVSDDLPSPVQEPRDYMKLARKLVAEIRKQAAPRSKVTAKKESDGRIIISVDAYTPLVIDSEGYVYETRHGHVSAINRRGHILDMLESGFRFQLNALDRAGMPSQIRMEATESISDEALESLEGPLRSAAERLRESFGGYQFDAFRAWVIGVDRNTLEQLSSSGALTRVGDQFKLVPLRKEEDVDVEMERFLAEGWKSMDIKKRAEPVGTSEFKEVTNLAQTFWNLGYEPFTNRVESIASGLSIDYDVPQVEDMGDKVLRDVRRFDKHSRTWRAGVNLFRERSGRIDIQRLIKDIKASQAKAKKLMSAFDKLCDLGKAKSADWTSLDDRYRKEANEGYRVFMKAGDQLVKALQSIK